MKYRLLCLSLLLLAVLAVVPTSAQAQSCPGHCVILSWVGSTSPNVTGYKVYRSATTNGQTIGTSLATVGNVLTYTDLAVTSSTTYYYKVTAVCATCNPNESVFSNESVAVIPGDAPAPPTNVTTTVK